MNPLPRDEVRAPQRGYHRHSSDTSGEARTVVYGLTNDPCFTNYLLPSTHLVGDLEIPFPSTR